ncbi:MAG TPA: hypothetical protein VGK79_01895 [Gaiellaceae bacterium]
MSGTVLRSLVVRGPVRRPRHARRRAVRAGTPLRRRAMPLHLPGLDGGGRPHRCRSGGCDDDAGLRAFRDVAGRKDDRRLRMEGRRPELAGHHEAAGRADDREQAQNAHDDMFTTP